MSVEPAAVRGPSARVRVLRGGEVAEEGAVLRPGDVIGRLWTAALAIDHPSVSEAHAMLSLREGALWLLALRRRLAVEGRVVSEARLAPGLRVELAAEVAVEVLAVALPDAVPTVSAPGLPPVILPPVCALHGRPRPTVSARIPPTAPAVLWTSGAGWRARVEGVEREVAVGDVLIVEGARFEIGQVPLVEAGPGLTRVSGGVDDPLLLVASLDTVQVHREGEPTLSLTGVIARIVSELVAIGGPVSWRVVAAEVWPDEPAEHALRKRWDVAMTRLRQRLREARVRPDLVRADGKGAFELVLRPHDRVEDRL